MKKVTIKVIQKMHEDGIKIPVLTAYGFAMASLLDKAGLPLLLVGDSVGMVEAGYDSTIPVTVDEMIYHTRSVQRGAKYALVIADMPFMSYQVSIEDALMNAGRLVKEGGAEGVKVEGGTRCAEVIRAIREAEIPVMGHVGLTPQSVNVMGGYKVQGRGAEAANAVMEDARAVEEAGAFAVVLEAVPSELAADITDALTIPTIGIGAGPGCDGQVLVLNDMLGLNVTTDVLPKFVKQYADLSAVITEAAGDFVREVISGTYPDKEHSY